MGLSLGGLLSLYLYTEIVGDPQRSQESLSSEFLFAFFPSTGSHVVQAGLKLATQLKLALNSFVCLQFPSAGLLKVSVFAESLKEKLALGANHPNLQILLLFILN